MKVLLYTEGYETIKKSGLGKAIEHQRRALEDNNIEYTTNLKDDYDILHINFYGPKSYLYAKKMRNKGKKIVYHAHSTEEDFRNSFLLSNLVAPLFKKWICKCYKLGDQIITPTENTKRLLENYNLGRPIKAISNGVDTKFFEKDENKGKAFRKKYGFKDNDKVIVGIGLYIERKGILDFVELAKMLPEYKFIWFGYSPLWASPRKIKRAVTTKLDNLIFAGYVESEVIKSALSGANLYLFPTLEETEGIPIIEALTSKIPTLIRDIPVFEEYEADKVVYKAKNLKEFRKKIKQIIEGELPDITEEGYKCAKSKDVKIVGKELIKTYEETLKLKRDDKKKENNPQFFRSLALILGTIMIFICMLIRFPYFNQEKIVKQNKKYSEYERKFKALNTDISVKIYTDSKSKAEKALNEVENTYKEYDNLTNRYDKNSEIYKINNSNSDEYISIDSKLYDLISYGVEQYKETDGLININTGELSDIWKKYRDKKDGIPSDKELKNISTDINNIKLKDDNKINTKNTNIDLDYIKRGYITNKVEKSLNLLGIDSYIIVCGGNVTMGNYYEESGKYVVNVSSPSKDDNSKIALLRATNQTISSVSKYELYYEYKDNTYNHIIDSKTKYPSDNMVGVTVLCKKNTKCDTISTMLFMMDLESSVRWVNTHNDVEAIWTYITSEGKETSIVSNNFYEYG